MGGAPALMVAVVAAAALAVPDPGTGVPVLPARAATPAAVSAVDAGDAHVVAVGDIATYTGLDDAVADLVAELDPESLLLLGDIAYPSGSTEDFDRWFAPNWARFSGIWMPVPGNHEYRTDGVAGYRGFFDVPDWAVVLDGPGRGVAGHRTRQRDADQRSAARLAAIDPRRPRRRADPGHVAPPAVLIRPAR